MSISKALTKKQWAAMAAIIGVGVIAAGALVFSDRRAAPAEPPERHDQHEEEEAHAEAVKLSDAQVQAAGITLAIAGAAELRTAVPFPGEVRFDEDRTAHVVPRLAGVAERVPAQLGQRVRRGEVLAVIASPALAELRSELLTAQKHRDLARATHEREKTLWLAKISAEQDYLQAQNALQAADIAVQSATQKLAAIGAGGGAGGGLNRLDIRAPFDGTVVEKHLSLGEAVRDDASIFTLSDLSTVAAEFAVAPKDLAHVRVGQAVVVSSSAFESQVAGTVAYVGALLGEQTRTAKARVRLSNPDAAWRPGLFVTVKVLGDPQRVAVAVRADALQTVDDKPSVFVAVPGGFEARAVTTGRSDGPSVEIVDGLKPGERYAAANAFILKSELGKNSAGHGH